MIKTLKEFINLFKKKESYYSLFNNDYTENPGNKDGIEEFCISGKDFTINYPDTFNSNNINQIEIITYPTENSSSTSNTYNIDFIKEDDINLNNYKITIYNSNNINQFLTKRFLERN